MKVSARKHIAKVRAYQPGRPIDEVRRELKLKEVIKLASNESPFPPSPKVLAAIRRESRNVNRYPDGGCFSLRKALAQKMGVSPCQLIFGNGSDDIILMTVKAFVGPRDEVIMANPSFMMYEISARGAGAKVVQVPLKDFRYDLVAMKKAITRRTKMIFVGNPDNPAGTYVPEDELLKFLKSVPDRVLVFLDEAYYEFAAIHKDYPDTLRWLKRFPNVIITRTFSKMFGLAGLRVGYGIACPEMMDVLERIREPFNVNSLAQAAALACLRDSSYYRRIARDLERERQKIYRDLRGLGLFFVESATNFILVDVQQDGRVVAQALLKKGIIIRDMTAWGLGTFIRLTIGSAKENQKLLKELRSVIMI